MNMHSQCPGFPCQDSLQHGSQALFVRMSILLPEGLWNFQSRILELVGLGVSGHQGDELKRLGQNCSLSDCGKSQR